MLRSMGHMATQRQPIESVQIRLANQSMTLFLWSLGPGVLVLKLDIGLEDLAF